MLKSCLKSTFTVLLCVNLLCQGAEEKDGVGECSCDTEYQLGCVVSGVNQTAAIYLYLSCMQYLIAPKLSPTSSPELPSSDYIIRKN